MKTAFEMRTALLKMQKDYLIELEDAVVVTRDNTGKTKASSSRRRSRRTTKTLCARRSRRP